MLFYQQSRSLGELGFLRNIQVEMSMSSATAESVNQLRETGWDDTKAVAECINFLLPPLAVMHQAQFQPVLCQLPPVGLSWSPHTKQLPEHCWLWELFCFVELSQTNNVPIMEELVFSDLEMRTVKCLTLIIYKTHSLLQKGG